LSAWMNVTFSFRHGLAQLLNAGLVAKRVEQRRCTTSEQFQGRALGKGGEYFHKIKAPGAMFLTNKEWAYRNRRCQVYPTMYAGAGALCNISTHFNPTPMNAKSPQCIAAPPAPARSRGAPALPYASPLSPDKPRLGKRYPLRTATWPTPI
jgi:hypothetical protein